MLLSVCRFHGAVIALADIHVRVFIMNAGTSFGINIRRSIVSRENSDGKGTRCIWSIFAMRASVPIQNIVLDLALLANVKSSNFKNEYGQSMHVPYILDWDGGSHCKNRPNAASALPI